MAKKAAKKTASKATTTKKAAPKKAAAKKTTAKASASGGGFMKELGISDALAAVIGNKPLPRTEVTKKLWAYIKKHGLQDPKNKRDINADDKLKAVFGKGKVNMFEMTKLVSKHLK